MGGAKKIYYFLIKTLERGESMFALRAKSSLKTAVWGEKFFPFLRQGGAGGGPRRPPPKLPAGENFEIQVSSNGLSSHLRHILACLRLEGGGHISDLKGGGISQT